MDYGYTYDDGRFFMGKNTLTPLRFVLWAPEYAITALGMHGYFHAGAREGSLCEFWRQGDSHRTVVVGGKDHLTGLEGPSLQHYPTCPVNGEISSSYISTSPGNGIGLRSVAGHGFMSTKEYYSSINDNLGVYVGMRSYTMRPFSGPTGVLDVRTGMGVESMQVPEGTQVSQKVGFVIYNVNTDQRLEYTLNILTAGVYQDNTKARVVYDPNQLHSFVGSPIPAAGETMYSAGGRAVLRSLRSETQHEPFSSRSFRVEITWEMFVDMLIEAGIVSPDDELYRDEWELKHTRLAQEIYNPNLNNIASIGGMVKYVQLEAI